MLELIKDYLSDKNKLWKTIMIFSIVLFFLALSLFIWRLFFPKTTEGDNNNLTKKVQNEPESSLYSQKCEGCVRRLLDGIYVKPEEANLPPIAIIIDNHPSARPQDGLEKASLVYEAEVEGSYTRFMAVFATTEKIKKIGPIRSTRSYFVDWAEELNAIHVHCGGSPEALVEIAKKNIADLNEMYNGQYFWRAANRTAPHNIMASSADFDKFKENKKITGSDYSFWQFKDDTPVNNSSSTIKIDINFNHSDFKISWVYNKADNDYIRYAKDKPCLTADSNLIVAKNIIIQYAPTKVIDNKLRLKIDNTGDGEAIICLDGICRDGRWSKENDKTRTKFNFKNGDDIKFNAGTTWIEIIKPETSVNY